MERFEEHVISSPTNICWIFQSRNFSVSPMFDTQGSGKHFYVIKIKNIWDLDIKIDSTKNKWWLSELHYDYRENILDLCTLFSVLFGKRIEYCWLLKSNKTYWTPTISYEKLKYKKLPFNDDNERINKYVTMNWVYIKDLLKFNKNKNIDIFFKAWSFYKQALINIDFDVEIAYVDLIRSIDVLSGSYRWEEIQFDGDLWKIYDKIKWDKDLSKIFREYHWVGKKFRETILNLTKDTNLWTTTECICDPFSLIILDDKQKSEVLKNTYNVRSNYIHKWLSFWEYVMPYYNWLEAFSDLINSEPWKKSKENDCIKIKSTLTFLWLERIVRTCLIEYLK